MVRHSMSLFLQTGQVKYKTKVMAIFLNIEFYKILVLKLYFKGTTVGITT